MCAQILKEEGEKFKKNWPVNFTDKKVKNIVPNQQCFNTNLKSCNNSLLTSSHDAPKSQW